MPRDRGARATALFASPQLRVSARRREARGPRDQPPRRRRSGLRRCALSRRPRSSAPMLRAPAGVVLRNANAVRRRRGRAPARGARVSAFVADTPPGFRGRRRRGLRWPTTAREAVSRSTRRRPRSRTYAEPETGAARRRGRADPRRSRARPWPCVARDARGRFALVGQRRQGFDARPRRATMQLLQLAGGTVDPARRARAITRHATSTLASGGSPFEFAEPCSRGDRGADRSPRRGALRAGLHRKATTAEGRAAPVHHDQLDQALAQALEGRRLLDGGRRLRGIPSRARRARVPGSPAAADRRNTQQQLRADLAVLPARSASRPCRRNGSRLRRWSRGSSGDAAQKTARRAPRSDLTALALGWRLAAHTRDRASRVSSRRAGAQMTGRGHASVQVAPRSASAQRASCATRSPPARSSSGRPRSSRSWSRTRSMRARPHHPSTRGGRHGPHPRDR